MLEKRPPKYNGRERSPGPQLLPVEHIMTGVQRLDIETSERGPRTIAMAHRISRRGPVPEYSANQPPSGVLHETTVQTRPPPNYAWFETTSHSNPKHKTTGPFSPKQETHEAHLHPGYYETSTTAAIPNTHESIAIPNASDDDYDDTSDDESLLQEQANFYAQNTIETSIEMGNWSSAEKMIQEVLESPPSTTTQPNERQNWIVKLAEAQAAQRNWKKSLVTIKSIDDPVPDDLKFHAFYVRALASYGLGDEKAADVYCSRAIKAGRKKKTTTTTPDGKQMQTWDGNGLSRLKNNVIYLMTKILEEQQRTPEREFYKSLLPKGYIPPEYIFSPKTPITNINAAAKEGNIIKYLEEFDLKLSNNNDGRGTGLTGTPKNMMKALTKVMTTTDKDAEVFLQLLTTALGLPTDMKKLTIRDYLGRNANGHATPNTYKPNSAFKKDQVIEWVTGKKKRFTPSLFRRSPTLPSERLRLLYHAIQRWPENVCKDLIEELISKKHITSNVIDHSGCTLLLIAVRAERASIVEYLLDRGADVNVLYKDKTYQIDGKEIAVPYTVLSEAKQNASPIISDIITHSGAIVEHDVAGRLQRLHHAVRTDDVQLLKKYMSHPSSGEEQTWIDGEGRTPLLLAAYLDRVEISKVLLQPNLHINGNPSYQQHGWHTLGNRNLLVDKQDIDGLTALCYFFKHERPELMCTAIDQGAVWNILKRDHTMGPYELGYERTSFLAVLEKTLASETEEEMERWRKVERSIMRTKPQQYYEDWIGWAAHRTRQPMWKWIARETGWDSLLDPALGGVQRAAPERLQGWDSPE